MAIQNALNLDATGIITADGAGVFTGSTVTQYGTVVAGASNAVSSVAPSATSGVPLISQGSSADPAYGTAVVAGGGSGATTLTGVLSGNGTSAFTASAVTDNTVVMGSTSNLLQDTTITVTDAGEMVNTSQPSFFAYPSATINNITGDGAAYTLGTTALTELYDQNSDFNTNGTFTAPVTGKYYLMFLVRAKSTTGANSLNIHIVTTARTYGINTGISDFGSQAHIISVIAPMTATDTATFVYELTGVGADTSDIVGATFETYICGQLLT